MIVEQSVEYELAGKTEVLGENMPQCRFVHHKSHMSDPGSNPGPHGGKSATNSLSYSTAISQLTFTIFGLAEPYMHTIGLLKLSSRIAQYRKDTILTVVHSVSQCVLSNFAVWMSLAIIYTAWWWSHKDRNM
jgi:hypothetical protein